jgi:hypothetical protein
MIWNQGETSQDKNRTVRYSFISLKNSQNRLEPGMSASVRVMSKWSLRCRHNCGVVWGQTNAHSARRDLGVSAQSALEEGAFDPQNDEDARDRAAALIVIRQGQPAFRMKLLKAYNNRCAISRCDCPDAIEAAHIRPYKGKHTNHIKNGILLRCDIHTLVDLGKIRIDSNYKVGICDELQSAVYKEFHDKRLVLPKEKQGLA